MKGEVGGEKDKQNEVLRVFRRSVKIAVESFLTVWYQYWQQILTPAGYRIGRIAQVLSWAQNGSQMTEGDSACVNALTLLTP